jgi:Tfp pilus assembly protein PilN
MPSINLLPENFTIEAYKRREKAAIYILAVFFVLSSSLAYGLVELEKRDVEKNIKTVDGEIESVKGQIKTEIEKSDLLSSEYNKKDIEKVLGEHRYLSKELTFLKGLILQGVYLTDLSCEPEKSTMTMKLQARDYDTLIKQLLLFEDSFWLEQVKFSGVEKSKEDGSVTVEIELTVRKDLISFQEHYWDFGLGILSTRTNRYVEISNYAIALQKGENGEEDSEGQAQKVTVSFEGKAYDKEHLDEFEKSLKSADGVEKSTLNRFSLADDKPGVINFRGNVTLKYDN